MPPRTRHCVRIPYVPLDVSPKRLLPGRTHALRILACLANHVDQHLAQPRLVMVLLPSSFLSFISSFGQLNSVPILTILQNIYYGTLYAYTPEVLPSAHRGTGNGIAIGLNRIMGILSAVIAS